MIEPISKKGIRAIAEFGNRDCRIHVGPYGTGKTFCLMLGFGLMLKNTRPGKLGYLLCGKTRQLAVSVMGDQLTDLFGCDFKITNKKSDDPKSKDAMLFGHRIYFGGMNDKESVKRVLGKSYKGILIDELTSLTEEHFLLLKGRLRGEPPHWMEASTNPDGPKHWLKKYLDKHPDELVQWYKEDNITSNAVKYYEALSKQYYGTPYYDRYVLGQWAAADGLVYGKTFNPSYHIINRSELVGARYDYYKVGIDFGSTNPTVALLIGVMPAGEHIVLKEFYKPNSENLQVIVDGIINIINQADKVIEGIYIDPSAALLIKELNIRSVGNVCKANNNVIDGITNINTMLNTDMLFISSECKNTIEEFSTYAYKDDDIVKKENDHCMDALRYACMGRK